jgi:hypothetical protein
MVASCELLPTIVGRGCMRRVSMATRNELILALSKRYNESDRFEKGRILDEFAAITGYHRKHAMRVLRESTGNPREKQPRQRVYHRAVLEAVVVFWEASDRVCGKRLKAVMPVLVEALERHGHLQLESSVRTDVLRVSASTIDRILKPIRARSGHTRRSQYWGSPRLRKSIPVRTLTDWPNPAPGFMEADLVAHCGSSMSGRFIHTLVLTDVASGWTECAALLQRDQHTVTAALDRLKAGFPFPFLGFDTDNDGVFINETVRAYCAAHGIDFTRSRPYRKNDQALVEQKNGSVVRRLVGYRRFEGLSILRQLEALYKLARLFVNFFQPSFKLISKDRDGAVIRKRYLSPATPCQRLLADPRTPARHKRKLIRLQEQLDPIFLLREMRLRQERLMALADKAPIAEIVPTEAFFASLKATWHEKLESVRPIDLPARIAFCRSNGKKDVFEACRHDLRRWVHAEPLLTSRELLERLQSTYPGAYPNRHLRALQRRVKKWREELHRG